MPIGIVVTNAIVLIDRVKQNEETIIIREALVEATATRMRPIIMTAIATICAMIPLLFKASQTVLGFTKFSSCGHWGSGHRDLLTLIVIPCVYELLYFKKSKKQRAIESVEQGISL